MNLIGSIVVYAGLVGALVGGLSILRPLTFLGIWSRLQGVMLLVAGVVVFLIGANLPAKEQRVGTPVSYLDEFVPAYQFEEFHSIQIHAPRERVSEAIRDVTPNEIALYRTLTWIRRGGQSDKESMLNPAADKPLLDVALRTGFLKLAEEPDREIVLGTLVAAPKGMGWKEVASDEWRVASAKKGPTPEDFKALQGLPRATVVGQQLDAKQNPNTPTESRQDRDPRSEQAADSQQLEAKGNPNTANTESTEGGAQSPQRSGFALAAINFRLEDAGNGETLLTTETRVYATDDSARKRFAAYWRVIYPGSALIRVMWLRAIRDRAEMKQ